MKLLSLVIAVTLACSGCFTRAQRHEIVTTRSYARSFEQTWHAVVRFFAERNLPIRTIDRSSGIIYSEPLDFPADWLDCGDYPLATIESRQGRFNVFISTDPISKAVKVRVTATFSATLRSGGVVTSESRRPLTCYSTGTFERLLLDYLAH